MSPPSSLEGSSALGAQMQKQLAKIRLPQDDPHASDGYHVFISLVCTVGLMTSAIVLAFAIEMLR